jgi:hypothetical protein
VVSLSRRYWEILDLYQSGVTPQGGKVQLMTRVSVRALVQRRP